MTGSSKQTTQTTNSAPWTGAQPALNTALAGAQNLYNSGTGAGIYTGSTAVPWDINTQHAMGDIAQNAVKNTYGGGLSGQYQKIINNGGRTGGQQNAANIYAAIGNGDGFTPEQRNAIQNTKSLANASWAVSPELQKIIDQTNADANTNVGLANSAAGRYGSGLGNGAIADAVSKNTNNLLYSDLNNFQTRKDAANSNLYSMGQGGLANRMNAFNALGALDQQAFGNLGAAYTGMQAPAQALMQVGGMNEDLATRQLNDKLRIFDAQQNKPWEQLSRLNAIASGAGQLGGTQTTSQPGQNPWLSALGYGATGLGLLGSF